MDIDFEYLFDLDYKINYSVKNLNINKIGIEGILDLSKFTRLVKLNCSSNRITQIINIPNSLKKLECFNNLITSLDNLPENLEHLSCEFNNIKFLDNLPTNLKYLVCGSNPIESLDYLPNGLIKLECCETPIYSLNCLPNSLLTLNIQNNPNLKTIVLPLFLDALIFDGCNLINLLENIPETLRFLCCQEHKINNLDEIKKQHPKLKIKNKKE